MGQTCTCLGNPATEINIKEEQLGENEGETYKIVEELKLEDHMPDPQYAIKDQTNAFVAESVKQKINQLKSYQFDNEITVHAIDILEQFLIIETGDYYIGTWLNGKPHGKGKYIHKDGSIYEGYLTNGLPDIKGRIIYINGDDYIGGYENGLFSGQGTYHQYEQGVILTGIFGKGLLNGKGKEMWPNGVTYSGDYKNGKRHGKGKLEWIVEERKKKKEEDDDDEKGNKQEYYEGEFADGDFSGTGVYVWSDGRRYEGTFKRGKMHGKGVFTWKDKRKYEGSYKEDQKHGKGVFIWPDGRKWEGGWKFGVQHGKGVFYNPNKKEERRGIWKDGATLKWLKKDEEWPEDIDEISEFESENEEDNKPNEYIGEKSDIIPTNLLDNSDKKDNNKEDFSLNLVNKSKNSKEGSFYDLYNKKKENENEIKQEIIYKEKSGKDLNEISNNEIRSKNEKNEKNDQKNSLNNASQNNVSDFNSNRENENSKKNIKSEEKIVDTYQPNKKNDKNIINFEDD